MAFDIENFKVNTQMGFLKPSNFLVYIYPPNWVTRSGADTPDLAYLAAATSLPGLQILTTESKIYGQGPNVKMAYDIGATDITLKFYVDGDGDSLTYFYDWLKNIVNLSHVQDEPRSGAFSNQLSYRSEYTTKIDIMLFGNKLRAAGADPQDGSVLIFSLHDAYPLQIGEPGLDWQSGNDILTFTVTFTYKSFEYQKFDQPRPGPSNIRIPIPPSFAFDKGTSRTPPVANENAARGINGFDSPPPTKLPGQPNLTAPPTNLADFKEPVSAGPYRPTAVQSMNQYALNVRDASKSIRTEAVSAKENLESSIYGNKYIQSGRNALSAANDVRKTLGTLKGLNSSFKNELKQELKTALGGRSPKNFFKI